MFVSLPDLSFVLGVRRLVLVHRIFFPARPVEKVIGHMVVFDKDHGIDTSGVLVHDVVYSTLCEEMQEL